MAGMDSRHWYGVSQVQCHTNSSSRGWDGGSCCNGEPYTTSTCRNPHQQRTLFPRMHLYALHPTFKSSMHLKKASCRLQVLRCVQSSSTSSTSRHGVHSVSQSLGWGNERQPLTFLTWATSRCSCHTFNGKEKYYPRYFLGTSETNHNHMIFASYMFNTIIFICTASIGSLWATTISATIGAQW